MPLRPSLAATSSHPPRQPELPRFRPAQPLGAAELLWRDRRWTGSQDSQFGYDAGVRNDLNIDQSLSLIHETETAIMLLDEGIRVISEWDGGQDHRIRGLFSTSQGFERLLKLTMTLILTGEGKPPSSKDLKREYGHHLLQLLDDILNKAKDDAEFAKTQRLLYDIPTIGMTKTEIRNRPPFQDDIAFCRSDRVLERAQIGDRPPVVVLSRL